LHAIQNLPVGTVFDPSYCDVKFSGFIGAKRTTKSKNTRDLIEEFQDSFLKLSQADRDQFILIFIQTNDVRIQFANPANAIINSNYPSGIKKTSKILFKDLYTSVLPKYDVKDHYKQVYKAKKDAWCPFCGMERFLNYNRLKQDYDHLLPKSKYPVAAVNMHNLSPMGIICNRVHKKTKDLLADSTGTPRSAVNPYFNIIQPRFDLNGSTMSSDPSKRVWQINITPNSQEIQTWNDVFDITDRCKEDFLEKINGSNQETEFDKLIFTMVQRFKIKIDRDIKRNRHIVWDINRLEDEIENEKDVYELNYYHEYNFIKHASLDFLLSVACLNFRKSLLKML
jgi:hypothetical protein